MAKRILLYCVLDHRGGIETHVLNLARALRAKDADVCIAAKWVNSASSYDHEFSKIGAHFVYPRITSWLRSWPVLPPKVRTLLTNLVADLYFRCTLRAKSFDLIFVNARGRFGLRLKRLAKPVTGKISYHEHMTIDRSLDAESPYAQFLRAMDYVTVNSRAAFSAARPLVRSEQDLYVLPAMTAPVDKALDYDKPSGQPFRVGFIGNLSAREKGAHKLLDLWRVNDVKDMALTFYGPHPNSLGPLAGTGNVKAAGPFRAEDLDRVFNEIDLLVHPADNESLGLVLIEAMARGVPFVATHVGGIIDLAHDNPWVLTTADSAGDLMDGIRTMQQRITEGRIDRKALRRIYEERWSYEALSRRWCERC